MMEPNIMIGVTGGIGMAFAVCSVWSIVFRSKADRHPPKPAHTPSVAVDLEPLAAELRQLKIEAPPPVDLTPLAAELRQLWAKPAPAEAYSPQLHQDFERLAERIEAVTKQKTPPPPVPPPPKPPPAPPFEYSRLDRLSAQLDALIEAAKKPSPLEGLEGIERKLDQVGRDVRRPTPPSVPPPERRLSGPTERERAPIRLEFFNTLTLVAGTVYELLPPEAMIFGADLFNGGPGYLYLNTQAEPFYGDPHSETLPPGVWDHGIRIPARLYVLTDVDGFISVRLDHV